MKALRVIRDPPAAGIWNMAVDEMMLETVAAGGQPIVRFYAWDEPTLSLGYFQALADRQMHPASSQCPVVRRSTGGGAIVHDREITYSVAMPLADRWSSEATAVYDSFHRGLVAALADLGIAATSCQANLHPLEGEPFLCFQRRAKGDVLVGSHKIAGSAQRRRQGALLQHGSVILAQSPAAPGIPGLWEVAGRAVVPEELVNRWLAQNPLTSSRRLTATSWTEGELKQAELIAAHRFSSENWQLRRA